MNLDDPLKHADDPLMH